MANIHFYCRPTLKSKMSFNGHIVLLSNLDDDVLLANIILQNKGSNQPKDNCVSVELEPAIWQWLETKLANKLTDYGFCRITEQGIKDDYYQTMIKFGHMKLKQAVA